MLAKFTRTAEAAKEHPGTAYHVTMPLGIDDLMLQLIEKRVGSCVDHGFLCDTCRGTVRSGEPGVAAVATGAAAGHSGGNGHAGHATPAGEAQVCSSCPYAKAISEGATLVPAGAGATVGAGR